MLKAKQISRELANRVEEFAQQLLPGGHRAGNYWKAGDAFGEPGQSLYMHLVGDRAGQWSDAGTGEFGDILDLIALQKDVKLGEAMTIASEWLGQDFKDQELMAPRRPQLDKPDYKQLIKNLWEQSKPLGKLATDYLVGRSIDPEILANISNLRFLPKCQYREGEKLHTAPAMVAAIRTTDGELVALHRTYLNPETAKKADMDNPKRALGTVIGSGCWLDEEGECLVITEGLETALSLKTVWPKIACVAALSAPHLVHITIPKRYKRIIIAADNDLAGLRSAAQLANRMTWEEDCQCRIVPSKLGDFNDDLAKFGAAKIRRYVKQYLKT